MGGRCGAWKLWCVEAPRACGKITVSARPISSPATEHRMSGLLLMDVPWYTSIRPTTSVTAPTIALSASGGHGPPASQKASKSTAL